VRQTLAVLTVRIILAFSSNAISSTEIPSAENFQRLKVLANQYSGVDRCAEATQAQNGGLVFETLLPPRASLSLPGGPVITSKAGYDNA
jgi:hypothetical protein